MEGYLTIVQKLAKKANVVPAYSPTFSPSRVEVSTEEIYPTKRIMVRADPTAKALLQIEPVDTEGFNFNPTEETITSLDNSRIHDFFLHYPNLGWTLNEVQHALNATEESMETINQFQEAMLEERGKRNCIVTGRNMMTYMLDTAIQNLRQDESVDNIRTYYSRCTECHLGVKREKRNCPVVFGRGNSNAEAMIIGEGPGLWEEKDNIPFHPSAPAGGILQRVMNKAGLDQNDWYLTNAVICRPEPLDTSKAQNGKPTDDQIKACNSRLKRTLRAVSPKLIVLLGTYAWKAFYGEDIPGRVKDHRGWQEGEKNKLYKVYFTYHPAYIARVEDSSGGKNEKIAYLRDWQEISDWLSRN